MTVPRREVLEDQNSQPHGALKARCMEPGVPPAGAAEQLPQPPGKGARLGDYLSRSPGRNRTADAADPPTPTGWSAPRNSAAGAYLTRSPSTTRQADATERPMQSVPKAAEQTSEAAGPQLGRSPTTGLGKKGLGALSQRKNDQEKRPAPIRCKISVQYAEGEQPMSDLLRLAGGQGMDVIVESVASGSKAEKAGVKAGFALTAMNGRNEFMQLPGWQVRLLLEAPITLGFDPEPAQPQVPKCTEIRLTRAQDMLGIPPRVAVCGPRENGVLAEEVVFKQSQAPLWLSAWSEEGFGESQDVAARSPGPRLYELRRPEAHVLVGHAIKGARDAARQRSPPVATEWLDTMVRRDLQRSPSPTALCSMDCVGECLESEIAFETDNPADGKLSQQKWASPAPPSESKLHCQRVGPSLQGAALKTLPGELGDADAKARTKPQLASNRNGRSPLRWLAPVLERVWGESPSPRGGAVATSPSRGGPTSGGRPAMARVGSPQPGCPKGDQERPLGDVDRPGPRGGTRHSRTRGSSPMPLCAKGDDHHSIADPDQSAVWDGDAYAVKPAAAAGPGQPPVGHGSTPSVLAAAGAGPPPGGSDNQSAAAGPVQPPAWCSSTAASLVSPAGELPGGGDACPSAANPGPPPAWCSTGALVAVAAAGRPPEEGDGHGAPPATGTPSLPLDTEAEPELAYLLSARSDTI
uniref:PDZ domain-containing protein n=1 Tax=Alexandrium monilatum TaxID=311494 RepID=A0A7S4QAT5_9DINO|mmetsp:Transcript_70016/g.221063  ORF Transcript_70016/g.221063 Transcript_70016/m.221063 type:complete len:694 (+) Transcript_70016:129-2210(+)